MVSEDNSDSGKLGLMPDHRMERLSKGDALMKGCPSGPYNAGRHLSLLRGKHFLKKKALLINLL